MKVARIATPACAWLLVSAILVAAAVAQEPPPESFYLVIDPPAVYPGAMVRLMAAPPEGADEGRVVIAGREFTGFFENDLFWAYFAVDVDTAPGPYELDYEIGSRKGKLMVAVRPRSFAEEQLEVEPSYVELGELTIARVERESARLEEIWNTATPERLWGGRFVWPAKGKPGSPFGLRRVFNGRPRAPHSGMDVKAPEGTPVFAANSGKVALAEEQFFTGNLVVIDHGLGLYTYYAHLSKISVEVGRSVQLGAEIGKVGATGRATGPHLHWGAKLMGARIDPITLPGFSLPAQGDSSAESE